MAKKTSDVDESVYAGLTAQEVLGVHNDLAGDADQKRLADAPETAVEYIDYEEALKNYEARADVEPLEQRRAREAGVKFEDARFRRIDEGSAGVVTSGKDGNNNG